MASVMLAISNFNELPNMFQQLDRDQADRLKTFWETNVVKRTDKTWMNESEYLAWCQISLHLIPQTWGSTAGGWSGMGGAAMTAYYTTIIENQYFDIAAVYYGGKLVYICEIDDTYISYRQSGFRNLPGQNDCAQKLKIIYLRK